MRGHLWRLYLGVGALAIVVYYLLPPLAGAVYYVAVGASAAAAIVLGLRWHRPPRRTPWWLIAAAQGLFVAGDALFEVNDLILGIEPFPSLADALPVRLPGAGGRAAPLDGRARAGDRAGRGRASAGARPDRAGGRGGTDAGRRRAARRAHPVSGRSLLRLERARQRALGNPAAVARIEHAQAALSAEVQGLRELMASLRPPTLDEVGLEAALRDHIGAFARPPPTWSATATSAWSPCRSGSRWPAAASRSTPTPAPGCGSGPCSGCPRRPSRRRSAPGGGR